MSNQFPHPFGKLASQYRELRRKLPVQVSAIAVQDFKENFKRQGYQGESGAVIFWKPRKTDRKVARRALLIKSGRLRRSLRAAPTYNDARVVTDVPYAEVHNEGFKGTVSVKAHTRARAKRAGAKIRAHRRAMNIPARPFMITTKPLMDRIEKHLFTELEKIFPS